MNNLPQTSGETLSPAQLAVVRLLAGEGVSAFNAHWQDRDAGLRAMARSLRRLGPEPFAGTDRDALWREAVQQYLSSIANETVPAPKRSEVHGAPEADLS